MTQKSLNVKRISLSKGETLGDSFKEVKEILDSRVYLHEVMMRSSVLYKTIYMDMVEKMKVLEKKLKPISPAFLNWLMEYSGLVGYSPLNGNAKCNETHETSLPKQKKRIRKPIDLADQPEAKKAKKQRVSRKRKTTKQK